MKNIDLILQDRRRITLIATLLVLSAHLSGCGRQASPDDKTASAAIENRLQAASGQSALPSCPGTDVSILDYQYVRMYGANVRFKNEEATDGSKDRVCGAQSVAFSRKLLSGGRWLRERERVQDQNGNDEESIATAHVVILAVRDRSFVGKSANVSEIGAAQSFDGVAFSKWSASSEKVAQFNHDHPDRKVGPGPEWTINGTVDDRRNLPVSISCSPGNVGERQGDSLYINAGRTSESGVRFSAYCQAWFGVNVGAASRAIVKVDMGGQVHTAAAVIANVKRELQSKIEEIKQ